MTDNNNKNDTLTTTGGTSVYDYKNQDNKQHREGRQQQGQTYCSTSSSPTSDSVEGYGNEDEKNDGGTSSTSSGKFYLLFINHFSILSSPPLTFLFAPGSYTSINSDSGSKNVHAAITLKLLLIAKKNRRRARRAAAKKRTSKEENKQVDDNHAIKNDESILVMVNAKVEEGEQPHQDEATRTQPRTVSQTCHFGFPIREVMQPDGSTLFHHMQSIERGAFDMDPDWNPDWEPPTSDDSSSDQDEEEEEDEHE